MTVTFRERGRPRADRRRRRRRQGAGWLDGRRALGRRSARRVDGGSLLRRSAPCATRACSSAASGLRPEPLSVGRWSVAASIGRTSSRSVPRRTRSTRVVGDLPPPERCAVVCGVGLGAAAIQEEQHARLLEHRPEGHQPARHSDHDAQRLTALSRCASASRALLHGVDGMRIGGHGDRVRAWSCCAATPPTWCSPAAPTPSSPTARLPDSCDST